MPPRRGSTPPPRPNLIGDRYTYRSLHINTDNADIRVILASTTRRFSFFDFIQFDGVIPHRCRNSKACQK